MSATYKLIIVGLSGIFNREEMSPLTSKKLNELESNPTTRGFAVAKEDSCAHGCQLFQQIFALQNSIQVTTQLLKTIQPDKLPEALQAEYHVESEQVKDAVREGKSELQKSTHPLDDANKQVTEQVEKINTLENTFNISYQQILETKYHEEAIKKKDLQTVDPNDTSLQPMTIAELKDFIESKSQKHFTELDNPEDMTFSRLAAIQVYAQIQASRPTLSVSTETDASRSSEIQHIKNDIAPEIDGLMTKTAEQLDGIRQSSQSFEEAEQTLTTLNNKIEAFGDLSRFDAPAKSDGTANKFTVPAYTTYDNSMTFQAPADPQGPSLK